MNKATAMNQLEKDTLRLLKMVFGSRVSIECQADHVFGRPDFLIDADGLNLCVFSDGDFWHDSRGLMSRYGVRACASGDTETQKKGQQFLTKAEVNRKRDREVNKRLRQEGFLVCRLKERRLRGKDPLGYVSRCLAEVLRVRTS